MIDTAALTRLIDERIALALAELRLPEPETLLDSKLAAEFLSISLARLHNLVSEGRLPRHGERGHKLLFRRSELEAFAGIDGQAATVDSKSRYRKRPRTADTAGARHRR